jgi:hypothetical protein
MSRARLSAAAGALLLIAAILLPCGPASDYLGNAMPYQDPTEEMLQQQAAQATAIEHQLAIRGSVAAALAILGLAALIYAGRQRRSRQTDPRNLDQL